MLSNRMRSVSKTALFLRFACGPAGVVDADTPPRKDGVVGARLRADARDWRCGSSGDGVGKRGFE